SVACIGILAGLVAITAPCAFVSANSAVIIGILAGVVVCLGVLFNERVIKVDDPCGAISVHGYCGWLGAMYVGLFADGTYGAGWNGVGATTYVLANAAIQVRKVHALAPRSRPGYVRGRGGRRRAHVAGGRAWVGGGRHRIPPGELDGASDPGLVAPAPGSAGDEGSASRLPDLRPGRRHPGGARPLLAARRADDARGPGTRRRRSPADPQRRARLRPRRGGWYPPEPHDQGDAVQRLARPRGPGGGGALDDLARRVGGRRARRRRGDPVADGARHRILPDTRTLARSVTLDGDDRGGHAARRARRVGGRVLLPARAADTGSGVRVRPRRQPPRCGRDRPSVDVPADRRRPRAARHLRGAALSRARRPLASLVPHPTRPGAVRLVPARARGRRRRADRLR